MRCEPGLGGALDAPHLLGGDHLEGVAVLRPTFGLDLAEDDRAATAQDEIELEAAEPCVCGQQAVATQPVVPQGAAFRAGPDVARARPRRAGRRLLLR